MQAVPILGVFVVLAAVELAKIPAATVVFLARGMARYLALVGLLIATLMSFETVFNGIERYVKSPPARSAMHAPNLPGLRARSRGCRLSGWKTS